jgi:O-antigen/teichoic acid export membrane protein
MAGNIEPVTAPSENVSRSGVMMRNAAFLLGGSAAGWVVGLLFVLVVPRTVGPEAWGEFSLGFAITALATTVGGFGITTVLVKQIARERERSADYLRAGLATHILLSVPIVLAVLIFTVVARYSAHTKTVVMLAAAVSLCLFLLSPAVSALQALEQMHLNSMIGGLRSVVATGAAVAAALIFKPDLIVIVLVVLAFNVLAGVLQIAITHRHVSVLPRFDMAFSRRLIASGLPFWSNGVLLTVYIWIDSVLLSVLVSTDEVGYYAAPIQVVGIFGFLPTLVTTVVFPALASSFDSDFQRLRRLTRLSLSILVTFGLPISIGVALVGPNAIALIFGKEFSPSEPAMAVLALVILPAYIATLSYWVLAAVDQQRTWAYVMGAMAIVNPLINLVTIPFFQSQFGHGSLGAAVALLITDVTMCAAGLALMPRACFKPVAPLLAMTARAALATAAMAIPVWFLRDRFLPVPVLVGAAVFVIAAIGLGVFRNEGFGETWVASVAYVRDRVRRRRPEVRASTRVS